MVEKIKWNNKALDAFYDIAVYLEENFSTKTSEKFVKKVFEKIEVLKKYPSIGRKAPKMKTVRFILIEKNYRLYYRILGKTIIISSIFDTRQHPNSDKYQ